MFGTLTATHTVFNPFVEVNTSIENRSTCYLNPREVWSDVPQKRLAGDPKVLGRPTLLNQFWMALMTASHCIPLGKL